MKILTIVALIWIIGILAIIFAMGVRAAYTNQCQEFIRIKVCAERR